MSRLFFAVVDTSVLLAVFNRHDKDHEVAVNALFEARELFVTPFVLAELDYHLTKKIGGGAAADALLSLKAWASVDRLHLAPIDWPLLEKARELMQMYAQKDPIGLTDAVNATLAWTLPQPVVLALDHHYRDVIAAPKAWGKPPLQVVPART